MIWSVWLAQTKERVETHQTPSQLRSTSDASRVECCYWTAALLLMVVNYLQKSYFSL